MLTVLAFATLACAVVLGAVLSSENGLAFLFAFVGMLILFPVALGVALMSVVLSWAGGLLPVFGNWGALLGGYVDGAYGIPGLYYLLGSAPLWVIALFQVADEDAGTPSTDSDGGSSDTGSDGGSADEIEDLTDLRGVGPRVADKLRDGGIESVDDLQTASPTEITEIEGLGNISARKIKSQLDDDPWGRDSARDDWDGLTSISGVDSQKAEALGKAGYPTVIDLEAASQSDLAGVVGNALAARIKADVDGLEVESDESASTAASRDDSGAAGPDQSDGTTETGSTEADHDALTAVRGVHSEQASALSEAGYESVDDLRAASQSALADVVGAALAARIEADLDSADDDAEAEEGSAGDDRAAEESGPDESGGPESDTGDASDNRIESRKETIESRLETAMTDPFEDLDATRDQLVRAHTECSSLAELAEAEGDEETLETARAALRTGESRLEALAEIDEKLQSAAAEVPSDGTPSQSASMEALEATRERYADATEIADGAGFDTNRLERERDAVESAIARSEAAAEDGSGPTGDQADGHSDDSGTESPTTDELIDELRRLDAETDGYPMTTQLRVDSPYTPNQYYAEFGSWEEALEAAGIEKEQRLVDELRRVVDIVDGIPNTADIDEHGVHSSGTYSTFFDGWENALAAAGVEQSDDDQSEGDPETESGEPSEYIAELRRLNEQAPVVVTTSHVSVESDYDPVEISQTFGSWEQALEAADINRSNMLQAEIRRVADQLDCVPTAADLGEQGRCDPDVFVRCFGSWEEAVDQALDDSDGGQPSRTDSTADLSEGDEEDGGDRSEGHGTPEPQFATVDSITEDGRISQPFAVNVVEVTEEPGEKQEATVLFEDFDGAECRLNVWRKHDVDVAWTVDHWYLLEQARGKYWTSKRGEPRRQLSSTKDLSVTQVGADRPVGSVDERPPTVLDIDRAEESSDRTKPSDSAPASDDSDDVMEEDDTGEKPNEDIFNDIVSEFEELSE